MFANVPLDTRARFKHHRGMARHSSYSRPAPPSPAVDLAYSVTESLRTGRPVHRRAENLDIWVKVSDAAALAGIHVHTIRRWIASGRIESRGYRGTQQVLLSQVVPMRDPRRFPLNT